MNRALALWLAAGLFLGSAALNVVQFRARAAAPPAAPAAAGATAPAPLPAACIERLDLSPEQCTALAESCGACCSSSGSDADTALARLERALQDPAVERPAIDAIVEELCGARERAVKARIEALLRVREVLTPEQLRELRELCGGGQP